MFTLSHKILSKNVSYTRWNTFHHLENTFLTRDRYNSQTTEYSWVLSLLRCFNTRAEGLSATSTSIGFTAAASGYSNSSSPPLLKQTGYHMLYQNTVPTYCYIVYKRASMSVIDANVHRPTKPLPRRQRHWTDWWHYSGCAHDHWSYWSPVHCLDLQAVRPVHCQTDYHFALNIFRRDLAER